TGDVVKRYDENAIKLSIINLILTRKYERPFHPELSSRANDLLFDPISKSVGTIIAATVKEVIRNHEPRGQIISVKVDPDSSQNAYRVDIRFRINNQPEPINIQTFLYRVR
ncbi:MAG: GPW/gp25 family protein, partial [Candidatus Heimdallarchaeota archaeon]